MSTKVASINDTTAAAIRALCYRDMPAKIARRCRVNRSQVSRILRGIHKSGRVRVRVIPVAARMVIEYERENGIQICILGEADAA